MYKLLSETTIQHVQSGACIPMADGNLDYQTYLKWVEEGNIAEPVGSLRKYNSETDAFEEDLAAVTEHFKNTKATALATVSKTHAETLSTLTGSATAEERDTWAEKTKAAEESVLKGEATIEAKALFSREALAKNQTVLQRCEKSLHMRTVYLNLIGIASGFKTELEIAINKATTAEEITTVLSLAKSKLQEEIQNFLSLTNT